MRHFCQSGHKCDPIAQNERLCLGISQYREYLGFAEYVKVRKRILQTGLQGYFDPVAVIAIDSVLPGNVLPVLRYLNGKKHAGYNRSPDPEYKKISRVLPHNVWTNCFSVQMTRNINVIAHHRLLQGTDCPARFRQNRYLFQE